MKALSISYNGMEDITALEIKELIGKDSKEKKSCCVFDASEEELAKYCYKCQGANRILLLLDEFKISKIEDLQRIKEIDFSRFLDGKKSFAARSRIVENKLEDVDVQKATGDEIEGRVDLKNPDVTVFVYIYKENCYVGIDFSGEISKRDYKINLTREDLKGTIAYALVRLSGYSSEKSFLNLNSKSGTIAIEAALFGSGKSPHFYDKKKFPFLKFFEIDLSQFDSSFKAGESQQSFIKNKTEETEVYAFDAQGYEKAVSVNAKVAGVKVNYEKVDADCVVKHSKGKVYVKNLSEDREIKFGQEVLTISSINK